MKTLVIALVFGISVSGFAQVATPQPNDQKMEKMSPEQRQEKHLAHLTKELNLDAKQKKSVGKVLAEKRNKAKEMKAQKVARKNNGVKMTTEERTAFKNTMLAEKADTENQMKAILSADQYPKWQTMRDHNKEKMKQKRKEKI